MDRRKQIAKTITNNHFIYAGEPICAEQALDELIDQILKLDNKWIKSHESYIAIAGNKVYMISESEVKE